MTCMSAPRGSLLLEAIIATGIVATFAVAVVQLVLLTDELGVRFEDRGDANAYAQQGVEALYSINFADLTNVTNGKVAFASEQWSISAGSETLSNGMTRAVTVSDVQRDANCEVIASGGSVDIDTKELVSTVSWTDDFGKAQAVTFRRHRTRFDNPLGSCFMPTAASQVTFNLSSAEFYGGKQLREVYFTNTGGAAVIIDKISFTWNYSSQIDQVFFDNNKVWSSSGPGTPAGSQNSGVQLDIQNYTLAANQTSELNKGQFTNNMIGATLTMTVTFSDGSVFTSDPFMPQ